MDVVSSRLLVSGSNGVLLLYYRNPLFMCYFTSSGVCGVLGVGCLRGVKYHAKVNTSLNTKGGLIQG